MIGRTLKTGVFSLAAVLGPYSATALDGLPQLADVAPEAVQISPHVPGMGEHWAQTESLPTGPIYCVIEGAVVCIEYMVDLAQLESGTDFADLLPGIETPPISRIDLEFKPEGIDPHPVPLYQLHIYFAEAADISAY